jgi:hypothetical protein
MLCKTNLEKMLKEAQNENIISKFSEVDLLRMIELCDFLKAELRHSY